MNTNKPIIVVDKLSKSFKLPHEQQSGLKQVIVNFYKRKKGYEIQQVLNDVSFEINTGEFFGIVGRNGSGKSTLLKLLAGIYAPDEGLIHIGGSLTPFIELGVGFNPELTGRENVYLNGALLGFDRKDMDAIYDEIVEFAELERFMDQKLKNYSSGMQVRLAFSIAIRAKSDILLIDEVLAVGDAEFQNKCLNVFKQLKKEGRTIVFISHDMGMVKRFCDRAIMLKNGEIIAEGNPEKVAHYYEAANLNSNQRTKDIRQEITKRKNKIITDIQLLDDKENEATSFKKDDYLTLRLKLEKNSKAKNLGVAVYSKDGGYVFGTNTLVDKVKIGNQVDYTFKADVSGGAYYFQIGVFGQDDKEILEYFDNGPEFYVIENDDHQWQGLKYLEHTWKV